MKLLPARRNELRGNPNEHRTKKNRPHRHRPQDNRAQRKREYDDRERARELLGAAHYRRGDYARERGAKPDECGDEPFIAKGKRVVPHRDEGEDDDRRKRYGHYAYCRAKRTRYFVPDIDCSMRRDEPWNHLEDGKPIDKLAFFRPALLRKNLVGYGDDRIPAANNEQRNLEKLPEKRRDLFHH